VSESDEGRAGEGRGGAVGGALETKRDQWEHREGRQGLLPPEHLSLST
jgi:hypothetical protein